MSELKERARHLEVDLVRATDDLNEALDAVEDTLVGLDWGVRASVPLLDGVLAFGRVKGTPGEGWGLIWARAGDPLNRLRSAPRHVRIAAVGHFGALYDQMWHAKDGTLESCRRATEAAYEFARIVKEEANK